MHQLTDHFLNVAAAMAMLAGGRVTVEMGFWWFGYGYFSQEPGCL